MFKKLKAFWTLMQAGKTVADPALWKARQITSTMLVAVLWAGIHALESVGVMIPIDAETVDGLAVGVIAVANCILTLATTDKIGLKTKL